MRNRAMQNRKPAGFTLIELLVVITIITMLMAMLLPAVNHAVEAVRRVTCMSNQRELGRAAVSYESTYGRFPGYQQAVNTQEATWVVPLLPYISEQRLYDAWQETTTGDPPIPQIGLLTCPSDPPEQNDVPSLSMIVNAGLNLPGNNNVANGVFHDLLNTSTRMDLDMIRDGLPSTLLFSENIQATQWIDLGKEATVFVWHDVAGTSGNPTLQINGNKRSAVILGDDDLIGDASRPSSFHAGGVNACFADNHCTFLLDQIDYKVYVQLMTPFGQESSHSDVLFRDYLLEKKDYE